MGTCMGAVREFFLASGRRNYPPAFLSGGWDGCKGWYNFFLWQGLFFVILIWKLL